MTTIRPFGHFGLKLLSVGLAVLLWMAVSGEQTVERGLRVSLELQQFPPGLEIQGEPPSTVDVRVRGASGTLGRVSPGDIVAVLDLRAARVGRRLFHLTPEQVRAPFGVEVVQVTPPTVALLFENSATRRVPVVPAVDGKPAPGYVAGKASADPPTVEVVGPESAIERVTEALTEPVSVAGARERVRETVTVGLLDPALRLKTTRAAMVTVQVLPAPLERTVRDRPVHLRNLGSHLTAQAVPSVVAVGLRGSREALNRVEPDDIIAYVDLAGLGSGEYQLTARADVELEVGVTHVEPATVQVQITSAKN
jgi:YbbR domain-containing protein